MKKILLSMTLMVSVLCTKGQVVFNEIWYNPGSGDNEYIELYNPGGYESLDCYTILSFYHTGATSGFIAINLPNNVALDPGDYSVLASSMPFFYQGAQQNTQYNGTADDFAWTSAYLTANGGYIKNFQRNVGTYDEVTLGDINNILRDLGNNSQPANFITLLYRNGILMNGIAVGVGNNHSIPPALLAMPDLTLPTDGGVCAQAVVSFSTLEDNQLEYMGSGIGQNNGVHRTSDGNCGTWEKSASGSDDTPGATNGPSIPETGGIVVGGGISCIINPGNSRTASYFVVNSTPATSYPLILLLYSDNGSVPGDFDAGDEFLQQVPYATQPVVQPTNTFELTGSKRNIGTIVIARSTAGCFESILAVDNACSPLPVNFKSFTATRNQSSVLLKWETASERNNSGFAVERNVNGSWEQVGWVPTQALNGNSDALLTYTFMDNNNIKGISQYRIRQVDFDAKATFSVIRSVRGEGQLGKTVVYPNPSNNGRVNVVFEDASVTREISVADMSGRMIRQMRGITNNNITIENLNPGMYTIRIVAVETGEQVVEKIVVNKR